MDFTNIKPLEVSSRKASINGCTYSVLDYDEYRKNLEYNKDRNDIAVIQNYKGNQLVLPYKGEYNGDPISPGIYNAGEIDFTKYPDEILMHNYIPDKIVCLNNSLDIDEIIKNGEMINKLDEPFITNPNAITTVIIKDTDQPELKALKMAINAKHFDLDKYAGRFGNNFPNDKRQLKSDSITLNILKRYCENCDMEAILTIKDKNPDVPNPMGKEITVSLTDDNANCTEDFYMNTNLDEEDNIIDSEAIVMESEEE